jgi:hypothetical protein
VLGNPGKRRFDRLRFVKQDGFVGAPRAGFQPFGTVSGRGVGRWMV